MKRSIGILATLALLALAVLLPACNTTKGFGEDIENGGEALKHSAERNGAE